MINNSKLALLALVISMLLAVSSASFTVLEKDGKLGPDVPMPEKVGVQSSDAVTTAVNSLTTLLVSWVVGASLMN